MAEVQSVTMTSRPRVSSIWPNVILGLLVVNWPLLLLWLAGPNVELLRDSIIIVTVSVAVAATTLSYCLLRPRGYGSTVPVLIASTLSIMMIIVVGHLLRGEQFHSAKGAEAVSISEIDLSRAEFVKISNVSFDLQSLIWKDDKILTLFPLLGHKERLCAAPIIDNSSGAVTPSNVWGLASIRLRGRDELDCESLLKSLMANTIVLRGISDSSQIKTFLAELESTPRSDRLRGSHVFKIVLVPPISPEWLRAFLILVGVFLNAALFYILHLEGARSFATKSHSTNP